MYKLRKEQTRNAKGMSQLAEKDDSHKQNENKCMLLQAARRGVLQERMKMEEIYTRRDKATQL